MRKILLILLILPLAGCVSADIIADKSCKSYGAKLGTDIYIQCRMNAEQVRWQRLGVYAAMRRSY
ncbi:hypothetical protein CU102_12530 [Phyllobacterium brassicacearum]|uniref:Lipoprotein n=1 Tax=Phyllobacterium brassicacearum TaxID=314235 RepID=A0A2P7BQ51_9HYPH|nr:hypothetical protein [Phyllobacterium brassicacearum]PSH68584.1 hypothetical protein CU102_12530 [Phyllobacterium brassicacearum]TDQ24131.1 hypothetical protein DEV91_1159 [Phyllobacterium brassicacearum]